MATLWGCFVDITHDQGRTWIKTPPINVATQLFGVIQSSIFATKGTELKMVMRSKQIGEICMVTSTDNGKTWSDAKPISLPNPCAAVEALNLKDGRVLLFFNDSKTNRYPLAIALSQDDGVTWERVLNLETQEGEFSYPAAIQTKDGHIHITYTYNQLIKHVILDPKNL